MVKATGMIRRLDELGRIVIPKEIRKMHDIESGDGLEIFVENDRMVLRKHEKRCTFCHCTKDLTFYQDKPVCDRCLRDLRTRYEKNNV